MATEAQFNANRENAQKSTGARTPGGHYASSRNAVTYGLYTQSDFVLPEEAEIYQMCCINMQGSCNAVDALEELLAAEITGAAWRLRRCNLVDGDLANHSPIDPLLDTMLGPQIRSIERARSHSTSIFHRSLNQLRKLQKDRLAMQTPQPKPEPEFDLLQAVQQSISSIMSDPGPANWDEFDRQYLAEQAAKVVGQDGILPADCQSAVAAEQPELASNCDSTAPATEESASNCKSAPTTPTATPKAPAKIGRNAPCPCNSGQKFKRCCITKAA